MAPPVVTRVSVGQARTWSAGTATGQNDKMTTARTTDPRPFEAVGGLRWLAGYAAFGIGIATLYATTGVGFPCPFRAVTGWECPFCGGTRLGASLLHGDVAGAFAYNPLVFLSLVVGVVVGALWLVEALGGPRVRPPVSWTTTARRIRPAVRWTAVGVATALYVVVRHLF